MTREIFVWLLLIVLTIKVVYDSTLLPPLDQGKRLPVVVSSSLSQAKIAYELAEEDINIVNSEAELKVSEAKNNLLVSQIEFSQYLKDYESSIEDHNEKIKLKEIEYNEWLERIAWLKRMKAMGYTSSEQVEDEELKFKICEYELKQLQRSLDVLNERFDEQKLKKNIEQKKLIFEAEKLKQQTLMDEAELNRQHRQTEYFKRIKDDK